MNNVDLGTCLVYSSFIEVFFSRIANYGVMFLVQFSMSQPVCCSSVLAFVTYVLA